MPASPLPAQIAIIIVTFQNVREISECLHSLHQADSTRRVNLFLIDNASTDGTDALIDHAVKTLPASRFRLDLIFNETNLGFTRAVNQGLARYWAQPEHETTPVLFLNPDTILPPGSLAELVNKLYALPDTGVVAPQLMHRDGKIQLSCRRFPTHWDLFCELSGLSRLFPDSPRLNRWKMGGFDHRHAAEVEQPQGACLLARPEVVNRIGGWDERFPIFFSDVDWCRRVWANGWKIRFEPAVQIIHTQGVSVRQVQAAAIWSSHVSFGRYFRKHETGWREKFLNMLFEPLLWATAFLRMIPTYLKRGPVANSKQSSNIRRPANDFRF